MTITYSDYNPSICIPRVAKSTTKNNIINIFQYKLKIGLIKQIYIYNTNDDNFKKFVIHFKHWNDDAHDIKELINNDNIIKVVYEFPWFWKCSLFKHKNIKT